MCFVVAPAVMAGITLASMAASTGMSVYAAQQNASAQSGAANYQAGVARNNQIIANQNAAAATQAGDVAAQNQLLKTGAQEGSVRAAAAASGLDANSGSPLRLQSDTAKLGTLDALTIKNNAARTAYGYQVEGMSAGAQAGLDLAQASQARTAGTINSASSLVGGASSISDKWTQFQLRGAFGGNNRGLLQS